MDNYVASLMWDETYVCKASHTIIHNNDFFKKNAYYEAFFYTKSSQYGDYLKSWDANNRNKITVLLLHNFLACEKVRNKNRERCPCSITLTNGILYVLLPGEGF